MNRGSMFCIRPGLGTESFPILLLVIFESEFGYFCQTKIDRKREREDQNEGGLLAFV